MACALLGAARIKKKKPETIAEHFAEFERALEHLLEGRCCECALPGVEVILERARADFAAALPHLEQMERGATRVELASFNNSSSIERSARCSPSRSRSRTSSGCRSATRNDSMMAERSRSTY